jgi:hypothetical protein
MLCLQAQFSQMRPVAMAPTVGPRMPMFPPGVPGVGQQLFYGQPPPAFINPQVKQSQVNVKRTTVEHVFTYHVKFVILQ